MNAAKWFFMAASAVALLAIGFHAGRLTEMGKANKASAAIASQPEEVSGRTLGPYKQTQDTNAAFADGMVQGIRQEKKRHGEISD